MQLNEQQPSLDGSYSELSWARYLPSKADRPAAAEYCAGLISGAWNLRLLLIELGEGHAVATGLWPQHWFQPVRSTSAAGLRLQPERLHADSIGPYDSDELLEGVGAVCLWLGAEPRRDAVDAAAIELAQLASDRGLSLLLAGPMAEQIDSGAIEGANLEAIRRFYLESGPSSAERLCSMDAVARADVATSGGLSLLDQMLPDLPSDQRFQARIAMLSALAWELQAGGIALNGLERRQALILGEKLRQALVEATTESWASATVAVLLGAVRAKNTMDTRLRNMANDRLGLLVLLATARLSLRCRSFTVRDICRELGAVATGM